MTGTGKVSIPCGNYHCSDTRRPVRALPPAVSLCFNSLRELSLFGQKLDSAVKAADFLRFNSLRELSLFGPPHPQRPIILSGTVSIPCGNYHCSDPDTPEWEAQNSQLSFQFPAGIIIVRTKFGLVRLQPVPSNVSIPCGNYHCSDLQH